MVEEKQKVIPMKYLSFLKRWLKESNNLNYFYLKIALYTITAIILAIAIPLTIHYSNFEEESSNLDF